MTALKALTLIILILAIGYIGLYLYLDYRYDKRQKEFKDRMNKW
jgi:Flp pilus assembly protein TadB